MIVVILWLGSAKEINLDVKLVLRIVVTNFVPYNREQLVML